MEAVERKEEARLVDEEKKEWTGLDVPDFYKDRPSGLQTAGGSRR